MELNRLIYQSLHFAGFEDEVIAQITSQYQTPDRHYHDIKHISEMLDYVEKHPLWITIDTYR